MSRIYKNILLTTSPIFITLALVGLSNQWLCPYGLAGAICLYGLIIILSLFVTKIKDENRKTRYLKAMIIAPIAYMFIIPIGMLTKVGSVEVVLSQKLFQYILQEFFALITLFLTTSLYAKEKSLHQGNLLKNLVSPLSIFLIIRILFMSLFESRHLIRFTTTMPHIGYAYVIFVSIPMFIAIFILVTRKNLGGYIFGFFFGLIHLFMVCYMVLVGANPGWGPIVVINANIGIIIFSMIETRNYHHNNHISGGSIGSFFMGIMLRLKNNPKKINKMLTETGMSKGMRVLDFGCGIGTWSIEAARIVGDTGFVKAVDIDEKMIQLTEKATGNKGFNYVKTQLIQKKEDIKGNEFDFILLIDVLHLNKDKNEIVIFLGNRLSSGGKMLIKFEHFHGDNQIQSVLGNCGCTSQTKIQGQYWLLKK